MTGKEWRLGKRKSYATGEYMYFVKGPHIISDYEDWGYTESDARLMASAMALKDALIACRDNYGKMGGLINDPNAPGKLITKIRNALEKAGVKE